jgi:hypothetical protein
MSRSLTRTVSPIDSVLRVWAWDAGLGAYKLLAENDDEFEPVSR